MIKVALPLLVTAVVVQLCFRVSIGKYYGEIVSKMG